MSAIALLGVPSVFGFDVLLVRQVAAYSENVEWELLLGLMRRALAFTMTSSFCLAVIAGIVVWLAGGLLEAPTKNALLIALLALPMTTVTRLRRATMAGLRRVVSGH